MVIKRVRDYLEVIDFVASTYTTSRMRADLVFRGMSNHAYKLLPGIYRTFEHNGTRRFVYGSAMESEILHHFIKNAMSMIDHIDREDLLTWLTYAQHFGVPTRLMDFSANPLISLYFSCKKEQGVDGAVCVLNEKNYVNSLNLKMPGRRKGDVLEQIMRSIVDPSVQCTAYPVTFIPHYIDSRMEAQHSRFLIWGSKKDALETIAEQYGSMLDGDADAFFCKIRIDGESKVDLLRELSFLGVNEKKLFPGLDGIGKYIAEYYRMTAKDYE